MNSFLEANDIRNYQNTFRPDLLRFSTAFNPSHNFATSLTESSSNYNDTYFQSSMNRSTPIQCISPINVKTPTNKFNNIEMAHYDLNSNCSNNKNENLIGFYDSANNPNLFTSQKCIQSDQNQNILDSNFVQYSHNEFNSYLNNVSLQLQTDINNNNNSINNNNNNNLNNNINNTNKYNNNTNENYIKLNLFQQIANDSNFKQYSGYNLFSHSNNHQLIENKNYQFNHGNMDNNQEIISKSNSSNQINHINNNIHIHTSNNSANTNIVGLSNNLNELKPRKIKKSRILFSQWQINELEKLFKKQKYVTSNERELMAKRLKLQANQVKIWFQNRRYKIKKQNELQKE